MLGRGSIDILAESHRNLDCEGASKIYGCLVLEKADGKEDGQSGVNTTIFDYYAFNFCLELWMRNFNVRVM